MVYFLLRTVNDANTKKKMEYQAFQILIRGESVLLHQ